MFELFFASWVVHIIAPYELVLSGIFELMQACQQARGSAQACRHAWPISCKDEMIGFACMPSGIYTTLALRESHKWQKAFLA